MAGWKFSKQSTPKSKRVELMPRHSTFERQVTVSFLTTTVPQTNGRNGPGALDQQLLDTTAPLRNLPLDFRNDECLLRVESRN